MIQEIKTEKFLCQMFKRGISHWGNKVLKRCKSIATKEFEGKKYCVNCYNKTSKSHE